MFDLHAQAHFFCHRVQASYVLPQIRPNRDRRPSKAGEEFLPEANVVDVIRARLVCSTMAAVGLASWRVGAWASCCYGM